MKILLVDDEALAREGLVLQLQELGCQAELRECSSGRQAIAAINEECPDLIFLDINMPDGDGFSVIEEIGIERMPLLIFLTAYDEYAIDAFKVNALDYLLKPVSNDRLAASLDRAARLIQQQVSAAQTQQLQSLMAMLAGSSANTQPQRLMVRSAGHIHFLKISEINWIQADGDYVTVHTAVRKHLIRDTMKQMEARLQEHGFQRIHRSTLVRTELIRELIANDNGDYRVLLHDSTELKLSRSYREQLCQRLQFDLP